MASAGEPRPDYMVEVHAIADSALFVQFGSGTEGYARDVFSFLAVFATGHRPDSRWFVFDMGAFGQ